MSEMMARVKLAIDDAMVSSDPFACARAAIEAVRSEMLKAVDVDQDGMGRDDGPGLDNEIDIYCSGQDFVIKLLDAALKD